MLLRTPIIHILFLFMACLNFSGCDMLDYHPYDTRFDGERNINSTNKARIEQALEGRKQLRFAVISDTQRWYDATHEIVDHINANEGIDFVIHCGDLTDFALTDEFEWMRDELQRLHMPYVVAIGNHDCIGTGKATFRNMYGPFEYSFTAGDTHFVVLNTNGLEFSDTPNFFGVGFLRKNITQVPISAKRTVVVMHVPPGSDQYPLTQMGFYLSALEPYPNVQFALCGHEHSTVVRYPFPESMPYYQVACADKRSYLVFNLNADGTYDYEEVFV